MLKYTLFLVFFICFIHVSDLDAQLKEDEKETDPLVLKKLEWFQDSKFGLMMHWGTYSQWGIVESWSLCSEDEPWCRRKIDDYDEYKRQYTALKNTFNPVKFNPEKWAAAAKEAGMKYVVFTTKHHDGFSMFDTKQTDYKITDTDCPFHSNSRANVTKEIFEAFRKEGFGTGAYFSKPDWNSEYYWWPRFATPDRNVNYDPKKYPERWEKFKDFTYKQIEELMTGYGKVDILWFDGGWVRPKETVDNIESKRVVDPYDQDIDMPKIAEMAREHQPGLIIVDRTVTGKYENYRTPEQHVPDKPLNYPWETCMTMASSWSFVPGDRYKPARRLIHLLVDIVAKGGNFLLNVGPDPNGEWAPDAYNRLKEIGSWMKVNGEAIYSTNPVAPYKETKICFTSKKDGTVYALYLADKEEKNPPSKIMLYSHCPEKGGKITMLGVEKEVKWEKVGEGVLIYVPDAAQKEPPCKYAWTFKIEK
ncbi:alpha-L-fucosidase [candidate division KSB1 bacterium]